MPDTPSAQAAELQFRARFFRIGCIANVVLFVLLLAVPAILFPAVARTLGLSTPAADEAGIRSVLDAQVVGWNKGDLDGFMEGYWRDEKLTFISGDTITRGWDATRERYLKRYKSEGKEMGQLSFTELHVESFSPNAAMARGRYVLVLSTGTDTGRFTLALRKLPEGWRIVHDHTSVADRPPEKK